MLAVLKSGRDTFWVNCEWLNFRGKSVLHRKSVKPYSYRPADNVGVDTALAVWFRSPRCSCYQQYSESILRSSTLSHHGESRQVAGSDFLDRLKSECSARVTISWHVAAVELHFSNDRCRHERKSSSSGCRTGIPSFQRNALASNHAT